MHTSRSTDNNQNNQSFLQLEDGSVFSGFSFGAQKETAGEVVFNTGMVGYPESFTDPSYRGQILTLTYPLIGNYGVPADMGRELAHTYESTRIHMEGLVVSEYSEFHHHWSAEKGLSDLLKEQDIAGIQRIDTRALTKKLREHGTMAGRITAARPGDDFKNSAFKPRHVVSEVSTEESKEYLAKNYSVSATGKRIAVIDCGCKHTIIKSLLNRGVDVVRMPWNSSFKDVDADGILFSNGPGDPQACDDTVELAKAALAAGMPTFGICLGSQAIALAAGADTYKLKFGHRGQNQPCKLIGSPRFFITSQNHGYAVHNKTLPDGWEVWFENVNDGTNEGIRHATKPAMGVQFHPEAMPGPVDTGFLFDEFVSLL